MAYEKAEIRPLSGGPPIRVQFNPTEYELESSIALNEKSVVGSKPDVQFAHASPDRLSMELLFDTYEQGTDVRSLTDRVYKLAAIDPSLHRPPIVEFVWARFRLRCWVESVSGRFTLFLDTGRPVRATLTVKFREFVDEQPKLQSADRRKTYLIQRGDSLASIAYAEYGDARTWRPIAIANEIANPRTLVVGRRIVIPPLAERQGSA